MNHSSLATVRTVAIGVAVAVGTVVGLSGCSNSAGSPTVPGAGSSAGVVTSGVVTSGSVASGGVTSPSTTTDDDGATAESSSGREVFDPRSDEFPIADDDLVFGDQQQSISDAIRSGAAAVADGQAMRHLERSYGGGNYITETWCSDPAVTADECETGRAPKGTGWITVEHLLFTYDGGFTVPKQVEKQSLQVRAQGTAQNDWSLAATVGFDEQGAGVFRAGVHRVGTDGEYGEAVTIGPATTVELDTNNGDRVVSGKSIELDVTDDLATQLEQFTTSADELSKHQLAVLDALQQRTQRAIDGGQFEVCIREDALHRGAALGAPAPACNPVEPTADDAAALQHQVDDWFDTQRTLLADNSDEIFAVLTDAYPWDVLAG